MNIDNIDWQKYINDIQEMESMNSACKRYMLNLKSIITKNQKFKQPPVLMLSGGVDSMMLGTVLKKYFNLKHSITIACVKDTSDIQVSQNSAKQLGITNDLITVEFDEIMNNLSHCQGKDIITVNSLLYYQMFRLGLQKANIGPSDLVQGDGADTLLGSIKSFMYIDTPYIQKKYNVSRDIARTTCKIRNYQISQDPKRKRGKGASQLFVDLAKELGHNPIMAFKDKATLEWVNRLPYSFANVKTHPHNKHLHQEFIRYMGYDASQVKRTIMQKGTGVYDLMKEHLVTITKAKTPNGAVKQLLNPIGQLPI